MDKRSKEVIKDLIRNALTDEDTFEFGCIQCGECCRNRHDILLFPYDLYRIAKYLEKDIHTVIEKYCEVYIGDDSKLPVVRVKSKIYNDVCSFLRNGKCSIHAAKPSVCALFPLGRASAPNGEIRYFIQSSVCNAEKSKIKVRDWLELFHLKDSEEAARKYTVISTRLRNAKHKYTIKPEVEEQLNNLLYGILYLNYDTSEDFMSQFEHNVETAETIFEKLTGKSVENAMKGIKLYSFSDIERIGEIDSESNW